MISRYSGLLSERPAALTAKDTLYLATDEPTVYRSTGTDWVERRSDPDDRDISGVTSGTLSARSSPGTRVGWLYFATDTGTWYEAFPGAWFALTSGGSEGALLTIVTKTADYILVANDAGKYVRMNKASAVNLTVPPNSSVPCAVGTQIVLRNSGAGQVTIVPGGGVTINSALTLKLRAQHSAATLVQVAVDEWDLAGDLEAP